MPTLFPCLAGCRGRVGAPSGVARHGADADGTEDRIVAGRQQRPGDTHKFHVFVPGANVVLIGTVRCWSERQEAERVGRSEPK
jgi:hypothetical protein